MAITRAEELGVAEWYGGILIEALILFRSGLCA
jgi:hypothetical protein